MLDCYDTRSFPQSLIDAILEIWDTASSDGPPVVSTECQEPQDRGDAMALRARPLS
jgi:hypothetical protein